MMTSGDSPAPSSNGGARPKEIAAVVVPPAVNDESEDTESDQTPTESESHVPQAAVKTVSEPDIIQR